MYLLCVHLFLRRPLETPCKKVRDIWKVRFGCIVQLRPWRVWCNRIDLNVLKYILLLLYVLYTNLLSIIEKCIATYHLYFDCLSLELIEVSMHWCKHRFRRLRASILQQAVLHPTYCVFLDEDYLAHHVYEELDVAELRKVHVELYFLHLYYQILQTFVTHC